MTRDWGAKALALALVCGFGWAGPASAAIQTDPLELYQTMRQAYDEGVSKGWPFLNELYYQSTILDAGRSYALFAPTNPQYAEVAALALQIESQLHYDPLLNDDASEWYVREAAQWVKSHGAPDQSAQASALLARLDAGDRDAHVLAQQAEEDALANAKDFHRDNDARMQVIVADVRAYNLTRDRAFRSALLLHAADPAVPLLRVPDPEVSELFALVAEAQGSGDFGFTAADRDNARLVADRRRRTPELQVIGHVIAVPHALRLTRTAPADEYFGRTKLSPIGVANETIRIGKYLDSGWGDRMSGDALWLDDSIADWQRQYPHDPTLPQLLLNEYHLLKRVASADTLAAAEKVRSLILVQYAGTPQARELAAS